MPQEIASQSIAEIMAEIPRTIFLRRIATTVFVPPIGLDRLVISKQRPPVTKTPVRLAFGCVVRELAHGS
jgi:hypothetical protein